MNILVLALLFNLIGSVVSLAGGIFLLSRKGVEKFSHYLASFAAGTLLGAVFFDLLPESLHEGEETIGVDAVFLLVLLGILFFFVLERLLHWFHHHGTEEHQIKGKPIVPLVITGDTIHNFVDGVAIASAFLINIPLGIVTSLAVGFHELPQEIGDFGVLLRQGLKRKKIILVNLISAAASFAGVILAFYFGSIIEGLSVMMLAVSSGFFLYIALSDLIPEIHHENKKGLATIETLWLFAGVVAVFITLYLLTEIFRISH